VLFISFVLPPNRYSPSMAPNPSFARKGGPTVSGPTLLPGRKPAEKRPRQETPTKEQKGTDWQGRISEEVEWTKRKIGEAVMGFKTDKIINLGASVVDFFNGPLVEIFEKQASTLSDLCVELNNSNETNCKLRQELAEVKEELDQAKLCRGKVEAKASTRDMEDKVRVSIQQFKVSDLNVGGAITDRKELAEAAKKALTDKVRTDLRKQFDEKIKQASFKVLASKAFKRQENNGEYWTAPLLVTIPDRETRWEVENILRKSKVFPGFHWPREMVDSVKVYRKVVSDMGYSDENYHVRVRPEERDGSVRIKADIKAKAGTERFMGLASFNLPPLDASLQKTSCEWSKPVWISRAHGKETQQVVEPEVVDFTEDVEINNI
jgi:hypothetical protein